MRTLTLLTTPLCALPLIIVPLHERLHFSMPSRCQRIVVQSGNGARRTVRDDSPEVRAITFLAQEVPQWSLTNNCFSCHNNGDAARALYVAKRLGYLVSTDSLKQTNDWLRDPDGWDRNDGDSPFHNKRLAHIQFSAALRSAIDSGDVQDRVALMRSATLLANEQDPDGSWLGDTAGAIGSPATYGPGLGTYVARETLRAAGPKRFATNINKADEWLRRIDIQNVNDASVVLLSSADADTHGWRQPRDRAFSLLAKAQSDDGGWGPFITARPEPFDTALALLALARNLESLNGQAAVKRGREFLIANQQPGGSWSETTRPAGAESYAQRISTSGWATLALLMTR